MEDSVEKCGDREQPPLDYAGRELKIMLSYSTEDERCGSSSCFETSPGEEARGASGSEQSLPQSVASSWPTRKVSDSDADADDERTDSNDAKADKLRGLGFPSCCWEKTCQAAGRECAPHWQSPMPSPISAVSVLWFPTSSSPLLGRQLQVMQLGSSSTATVFGQLWRLEPLPPEKKSLWRREMEWLLCVSDHIVELVPSWQTFPDGSKLEVHTCMLFLLQFLWL
ncbi:hypothetical protein GW17_00010934 [Ensete ventricosum]|nr:hypothetical protein GW17_00010934 [Ensete ventricosum]